MSSPSPDSITAMTEALRRHIHDIRGHLSPAMLRADSLALSQDERTRRAAQDILTALDAVTKELGIMRRLLARPVP